MENNSRNTNKSVQTENGFTLRRIGRNTYYLRSVDENKTVWVGRTNPTVFDSKPNKTWAIYVTDRRMLGVEQAPVGDGFKTHDEAEKWAMENVPEAGGQ